MVAAKKTTPRKREEAKPDRMAEEPSLIEREVFDWGVRLTAYPFRGTENHAMVIRSEVHNFKPGRGCEIRITFPAASLQNPLRLLDAQAWNEALSTIITDTRALQAEMRKAGSGNATKKKQRP